MFHVLLLRPESLKHVVSAWSAEVRHFCRGVPVILVANKTDLRGDPRTAEQLRLDGHEGGPVTREETGVTARRIRAEAFVECSALRGDGVQEVFQAAARAAIARRRGAGRIIANRIKNCVLL